jgi:acyl-CoA thioesterase
MGSLFDDTMVSRNGRVSRNASGWSATLAEDWTVWALNGGYLAAVMLRACGAMSGLGRPASVSCYFLAPPKPGTVQVDVERLRVSRKAEALAARMTQNGIPVAHGMVWMVAEGLSGLSHDAAVAPPVPRPEQLASSQRMLTDAQWAARPPMWRNFEERPIDWPDDWVNPSPRPPRVLSWLRFVRDEVHDDPVVDAGRSLVLLDLYPPSAAYRAYDNAHRTHNPTSLDLHVTLHRAAGKSPWLLIDAEAPLAADGLVAGRGSVWSESGELLATSTQQLLCRSVRSEA